MGNRQYTAVVIAATGIILNVFLTVPLLLSFIYSMHSASVVLGGLNCIGSVLILIGYMIHRFGGEDDDE